MNGILDGMGRDEKEDRCPAKEVFINQKNKDIDPTNQKLVAI